MQHPRQHTFSILPLLVLIAVPSWTSLSQDGCDPPDDDITPSPEWIPGNLSSLPDSDELEILPGGGTGVPVFTSNNPEAYYSPGFLYQCARTDPERGGETYPLSGSFGVYLHHLNDTGQTMYLHVLITNPTDATITVSGYGSGYNQTDTGGLGKGYGPDYQVAEDWLTGDFSHVLNPVSVGSFKATDGWVKSSPDGQEVDARLEFTTSGDAYIYVIASESSDVNSAVNLTQTAAEGNIAVPGDPPPPYGREAGVYSWDTWLGQWELAVPGPGYRVGYMVNTATGTGWDQIQAFPALTHFSDSSTESVGMYGNFYDFSVTLRHSGEMSIPQRVGVYLAAYGGGSPSFYFNGPILANGALVPVYLTPSARLQRVLTVDVPVEGRLDVDLLVPIPGLTSIPQALFFATE